jgi:hypothetical protein
MSMSHKPYVNGERVMRSKWFNGDAGFVLEDREPVAFFSVKGNSGFST